MTKINGYLTHLLQKLPSGNLTSNIVDINRAEKYAKEENCQSSPGTFQAKLGTFGSIAPKFKLKDQKIVAGTTQI